MQCRKEYDGTTHQRQLIARNKPSAFVCPTATGTADLNTWSFQGGHCDCAVGKLYKTYFKHGMCLTGPKIDVKSKKKAFIYRPCVVKLRRAVNFLISLIGITRKK
jgi:hypothetical protein